MYTRFYGDNSTYPDLLKTGLSSWNSMEFTFFIIHFTSLVLLFVFTCFADSRCEITVGGCCNKPLPHKSLNADFSGLDKPLLAKPSDTNTTPQTDLLLEECPDQRASFLSQITYFWIDSLILKGFLNSITMLDLWRLNRKETSDYISPKFYVPNGGRFGTVRMIVRNYGWLFLWGSIFKLLFDLLQFVGPQLLK